MNVLIIDNHDSFVYNLSQYVGTLGAKPFVYRSDAITVKKAREILPDRIIISPGPGHPRQRRYFGVSTELLKTLGVAIPTLGVCLGHQGIAYAFGAKLEPAEMLVHGKTSRIVHDGKSVFNGIENPLVAARYHSLTVDRSSVPPSLKVTALSLEDGEVMGVRHTEYPIEGVQFHPESIMTIQGYRMIKNFLDYGVVH